jgi:hypothetical protein
MLDYLHIPDSTGGTVDYFPGISDTDGGCWVVWEKPRGAHMIRITCISGGGGGGSGFSSNTTTNRGGGGGGGSSAISIVTIPAYVLPDRLYVSSGIGGKGGDANPADGTANLGSDGVRSYVCIAQDTGVIYRVCYANSGKAGTTPPDAVPTGGTGGAAGTVATIADMLLASYGIRNFIAGQSGGSGGSSGLAPSINYPLTGLLLSGGTGGHGSSQIATTNTIDAPIQTVYNIFSTLSSIGGASGIGYPGREIYQPLLSTGATGGSSGGSTGTVAGGNGGAGGFGSGGGGGGAGGAGVAGGGGKGGNGLIIIHTW